MLKFLAALLVLATATLLFSHLPAQATARLTSESGAAGLTIPQALPVQINKKANIPLLSAWSAPAQINAGDATTAEIPAAAVHGNAAYAVWTDDRLSSTNDLFLAVSADGGQSWTDTNTSLAAFVSSPAIAVDPTTGALYVAFVQVGEGATLDIIRSADGGLTWPERATVSDTPSFIEPQIELDDSGHIYVAWVKPGNFFMDDALFLARSSDGGQSWIESQVTTLTNDCNFDRWDMAAAGNDRVYVVLALCGQVWLLESGDGGQSWTATPPFRDNEDAFAVNSPAITVNGPNEVAVAWEDSASGVSDLLFARSSDGGATWSAPVKINSTEEGFTPDLAARGAGEFVAGWESNGFVYAAVSANGGLNWSAATGLGLVRFEFALAADPATGAAIMVWDGPTGNQILAASSSNAQTGDCPLVEIISVRHLNNTTLGVVGFVDLNQVTSATLSVDGTVGVTPVDLIPLAQHNASGGGNNPGSEGRLRGLWSATLISPGSFTGGMMIVADATSANQNCQETVDVIIPPPGWRIEIETIDPVVGANPDIDGLDRVAAQFQSGDGSLPTLALSRYLYDPTQPGLAGLWQTMDTFTAQAEGNAFKNIVADLVDPGENLYRVTVDGQPQVEDVDGFYAAHVAEELATGENHQRRQALAFRDAVRTTLFDPIYSKRFSEQLLVAMGAQESGVFDNGIENGNGIMQVTCASGHQGETERDGIVCIPPPKDQPDDPPTDPYTYEATAQGIDFNVRDALLVLDSFYGLANNQTSDRPGTRCYVIKNKEDITDILITTVVYYNKGCLFIEKYMDDSTEAIYLGAVAKQLQHNPDSGNSLPPVGNNLSVSEFLADADYAAELTDLVAGLQCGQEQVDHALQQPPGTPFEGCQ